MTTTPLPFEHDLVETVAADSGVATDELDDLLARIQEAVASDDGTYEYSSQHNYGWKDDDAYYFYGAGIWETLDQQLSPSADLLDAARAVHHRAMVAAAADRDKKETVEEMLTDGNEPLVVTNTAEGPPTFGQEV